MKLREWIGVPVHHVFIAAYPILYLLSINLGEVDPVEALVPLALSVGTALALFVVLVVVGVSGPRAALVVSTVAVVVLFFGPGSAAATSLGITGPPILVGWLLLGVGLVAVVGLGRTDLRGVTTVLNLGSVILVAITLVGIGGHLIREPATFVGGQRVERETSSSPNPNAGPGARQRDIYYFVLDGYGSPRALDQYLDVPDGGFMDWLENAGFEVLRETRSNYRQTPPSIASTLNMTYLDDLAAELGPDDPSYKPLRHMVRDAEVVHFLKDRGYSYVLLGSHNALTARSSLADVNPVFQQTSDFLGVLTQSTILPPLVSLIGVEDDLTVRRTVYEAAMWGLETFPELTELPGPKFVFMHLFLPHPPWVVDGGGNYVTAEEDNARSPTERYRSQYAFVDREVQELIAGLLDVPEEEQPIIIVGADHGPDSPGMREVKGNVDWTGASDAELDLKFSIFTAYHLPGVDETCLYPGMSSVNQFRLVFDLYFDAGMPLLPDRSYVHPNRDEPFELSDVTDRLPASGAGSDTETSCDV